MNVTKNKAKVFIKKNMYGKKMKPNKLKARNVKKRRY
tara:strand:- start:427 stop:537 length:111 start_codon:yes stop_codon:yes gene_type:complete